MGCVCLMDHSFSTLAVYSSALAFTSCLHRAWRSGTEENKVSPGYAHSPLYASGFPNSQEYIWAFQSPLCTSLSLYCPFLFFVFVFSVSPLLIPSGIATSGKCSVKQLPLVVFEKCSDDRAVCIKEAMSQVNKSLANGAFPESCQTCQLVTIL